MHARPCNQALAARRLEGPAARAAAAAGGGGTDRATLEQGLSFAGFAVLDCPLKRDSADVVARLQKR